MNEKSKEKKKKNRVEGCRGGEGNEGKQKRNRCQRLKPHWPTGLRLPSEKDVTCFIPKALEAEGIDAIDVSGGFFV